MTTLFVHDAGEFRAASSELICECAEAAISRRFRTGSPVLSDPSVARSFLRVHLGPLAYEVFGCLYLDTRRRLIAREDLFRGTINASAVYVREVIHGCIRHGAANLLLYHNHPSGMAEASAADEFMTTRIKGAAALIDVTVVDHWIIGESTFSFSEHGLI